MQFLDPDRGPDPTRELADGAQRSPMSREEAERIFHEMVLWEIGNGHLSAWRRSRIVRYAASLDISAVKAGNIIQQAKQELCNRKLNASSTEPTKGHGDLGLLEAPAQAHRKLWSNPFHWPIWFRMLLLVAVMGALKLSFVTLMPR